MAEGSDIIGRAAVEIVPDADGFVNRLRAQIEPGTEQLGRDIGARIAEGAASEMVRRLRDSIRDGLNDRTGPARQGEKTAGYFADAFKARLKASFESLPKIELDANSTPADRKIAELRLRMKELADKKIGVDVTDKAALAEVEKLKAELKLLTGKNQDISVRTNAGAAIAELTALRAAIKGAAEGPSNQGGGGAGTGGFLGGAIVAATSLIGPLTAAATAGAAAIAADVGAAALAYKGLQAEEKQATVYGVALQDRTKSLGSEFAGLEHTAAQAIGPGVIGALDRVKAELPTLNPLVKEVSADLGHALDITAGGTITALHVMNPLLLDGGKYAEEMAQKFADFAASPDFARFVSYARSELPIVAHDLGDLATAGVHIATALQPLGDELLTVIDRAAQGTTKLSEMYGWLDKLQGGPTGKSGGANTVLSLANKATSLTPAINPLGYVNRLSNSFSGNKKPAVTPAAVVPSSNNAERALDAEYAAAVHLAAGYGLTVPAYAAAIAGQKQTAATALAATAQLKLESDAGGLLKDSLDKLSGKQLSAAQTQNAFEQALVSQAKATTASDAAVVGLSSSAIQNRGNLLNLVTAAESAAEAYGSMDKSGARTQQRLAGLAGQIIDNAVANGENRDQVTAYINSVLKIPPVVTTKVDLQQAAALKKAEAFKAYVASLPSSIRTEVELGGITTAEYQLQLLARDRTIHLNPVVTGGQGASGIHSVGGVQVLDKKADGGLVGGIGGPRQDNQLILASVGERVIQNGPSQKYAPQLDAMIAGRPIPAFADGGIVTLTPTKAQQKAASKSATAAPNRSTAAATKAANEQKRALAAAQALAKAQADIRFTVSLDLSKLKSTGTAAQINSVITKLIRDVHTAAGKQFGTTSFIPILQGENARLGQLAAERLALTNKLKAADAGLVAQRKAAADEVRTVSSAVSSNFDITSLNSPQQFGTANPALFIQNLRTEATQVGNAEAQLAKLRKLGLDKNLVAQLGQDGPSSFAAIQSLSTASTAQIALINKLNANVKGAGNAAGVQVSDSLYAAGIASAEGYIKGLNSKLGAVDKAAETLANTVVNRVKKTLGIKSPSTVLRQHGRYTGEGFALGIGDRIGIVAGRGADLANAAVQPAQFGATGSTASGPLIGQLVMQPDIDPYAFSADISRRLARKIR